MTRTCLACGLEDRDVAMTLVEVHVAEQRVVSVGLVSAETSRGITGFSYADVRERYVSEPRCRDKAGCAARVRAMEPAPPPPADAGPDPLPAFLRRPAA